MQRRNHWLLFSVFACVPVGLALFLLFAASPPIEKLLFDAEFAFEEKNFAEAETLAGKVLARKDNHPQALLIAGMAAEKLSRPQDAVSYFSRVTDEDDAILAEALQRSAGLLFYKLGRLSEAERDQQRLADLRPTPKTFSDLAYLQVLSGRSRLASGPLLQLVKWNQCSIEQLCWLGLPELVTEAPGTLERCQKLAPDDPFTQLGLAFLLQYRGEQAEAEALARTIVSQHPELLEAHLLLGNLIVDTAPADEFREWQRSMPDPDGHHPDTWSIRGRRALLQHNRSAAIRYFLEAVVRHSDHKYALRQLAQLLTVTEEPELAKKFSLRSRQIVDYQVLLNSARERQTNVAAIRRAAELTFEMGRLWESRAWCGKAMKLDRNLQWPLPLIQQAESQLMVDSPQTMTESQPAVGIDLSRWPLPVWPDAESPLETNGLIAATESSLKFHDSAAEAGIDFVYFNGRNPDQEGIRMYETVGGGVAALDYDADGLPDVYFTQGTQWPVDPAQRTLLDRLYRNLGTGKFDDVTLNSMLVESMFGQGVAIGDYDGDGFGDLFIGNIGNNRLFRNNGDGTFSDATEGSGISGSVWTSSCAFADLNGDGFADIYEVNYLKGDDVFTTVCVTKPGSGEMCAPNLFEAEQDRLYLNRQDGTFEDVSKQSGIESDDGMGMGIVIANFDDTGRLGVFVANDHIYNFFFANETAPRGAPLKLRECAFTKGLGLNVDGWSQACMGVAAGDVDENGLLDLFVTNFYREPNCLYLHQPDHYFVDDTHRAGLRDSSYHVVGWGTQFLDADLDGFDDLVLTNGHVEDRTHLGRPYRMRPMFYRNTGAGRFAEVSADSLGSFFQKEQLGRGLARLDWNGDGREDFVISHLDTAAALITNQSTGGNFFKVRLRGVDSERDAIGAFATIECGDFKRTRQLIAGDGFQASNERQLVFGLGDRQRIDRLTVRWPTGLTHVWEKLDANAEIMLLEGSDKLFLIECHQKDTPKPTTSNHLPRK
jgi:tetratricopeptide (TPR) repeat protein